MAKQRRKGLNLVSIETERGLITTERKARQTIEDDFEEEQKMREIAAMDEELLDSNLVKTSLSKQKEETKENYSVKSVADSFQEIEGSLNSHSQGSRKSKKNKKISHLKIHENDVLDMSHHSVNSQSQRRAASANPMTSPCGRNIKP